jgi:hypothetical protein
MSEIAADAGLTDGTRADLTGARRVRTYTPACLGNRSEEPLRPSSPGRIAEVFGVAVTDKHDAQNPQEVPEGMPRMQETP